MASFGYLTEQNNDFSIRNQLSLSKKKLNFYNPKTEFLQKKIIKKAHENTWVK